MSGSVRRIAHVGVRFSETMSTVDDARLEDVEGVGLLAADLVATLGWPRDIANDVAEREFTNARSNSSFYDDEEDDDADVAAITFRAVEDTQQWLHDTFLDSTWPACPLHSDHPLWLSDAAPQSWCCPASGDRLAQLGQLTAVIVAPSAEQAALNIAAVEANSGAVGKLMKRFGTFIRTRTRT